MKILNPSDVYRPSAEADVKVREITEKSQEIAEEILSIAKAQIIVKLRFLDRALFELKPMPNSEYPLASDGRHLIYEPLYLLRGYRQSQSFALRAVAHTLMHSLFRHMFIPYSIDQTLWNLSCDLAAESMVRELQIRQLQDAPGQQERERILDDFKTKIKNITAEKLYRYFQSNPPDSVEMQRLLDLFNVDEHTLWYQKPEPVSDDTRDSNRQFQRSSMPQNQSDNPDETDETDDDQTDSGESGGIDGGDDDNDPQSDESETEQETDANTSGTMDADSFSDESAESAGSESVTQSPDADSPDSSNENNTSASQNDLYENQLQELEKMWRDISEHVQTDLETFARQQGISAGGMEQALRSLNRERYDYTSFLRKFATMHEVMHLSPDEFDYVYYTYGLNLYQDMPLIEPLEYREDKRIRDFVIAIDTSGSVQGQIVQMFLQKTYNILMQEETYDRRFNLHIIQCDSEIQEDAVITTQTEFQNYLKGMKLHGFGGTDFRPVFEYVEQLRAQHQFTNLKGLLYFTDGFGIYPSTQTDYQTAFVFLDNDAEGERLVPPWAIRIILETDDIE
ncbi:MAG: metallopeptidase [Clostridia bacterium]|nr:metallopeptidase [Clostridia bacterium]